MSTPATHQTIRLSRGKHETPDDGACVMELASMLAGEDFGDHPRSVSPVIADFLRVYNDLLADGRRQDLYRYAARVVGTRSSRGTERLRARACDEWADAAIGRSGWASRRRLKASLCFLPLPETPGMVAGRIAAEKVAREGHTAHLAALAFVDRLIELGGGTPCDLEVVADEVATPSPVTRSI